MLLIQLLLGLTYRIKSKVPDNCLTLEVHVTSPSLIVETLHEV